MIPPHPHRQAPTVHGINSRIVFLPWAMFCVYDANTSVFILGTFYWTAAALYCRKKLENLMRTNRQTDRHTDREFNYRGHSYPLWIVGGSGPICKNIYIYTYIYTHIYIYIYIYICKTAENSRLPTHRIERSPRDVDDPWLALLADCTITSKVTALQ